VIADINSQERMLTIQQVARVEYERRQDKAVTVYREDLDSVKFENSLRKERRQFNKLMSNIRDYFS